MTEATRLTEVLVVTVLETLWPLPMLLSVSEAADRQRWLRDVMEAAEQTVVSVVMTLCPLPMLLSVPVAADRRR